MFLLLLALACVKAPMPDHSPTANVPTVQALAPGEVYKSPRDHRHYRTFTLDNGLKALVISDPDTDLAAAALDVHIGQFSDPIDRQGLSHFLEHMLFMGTEEYPEVDGYRKFIQDHGGGTNASTSQEHTRYFFSIDHKKLVPAIDRFSGFFTAPLLDKEYVERERKAVHSEYFLKIKEEARRYREVRRVTGNPEHPFAKFSVGNLDTLADREDALVWTDLKNHYDTHYSASKMAVAVIGREDLDTLEQLIREQFSDVPSDGTIAEPSTVPPFLDGQLGVQIAITPLAERRSLRLHFPAPPIAQYFRAHPTHFISHLLGHEGKGSLFSRLKSEGWIESLVATTDGTEDHALITLKYALTEEGYAHIDEIVGLTFQMVRLIRSKGVLARYHQESKALAALSFRFQRTSSPVAAVSRAAVLHKFPAENVLNWWTLYDSFDEGVIGIYLDTITPNNMRMYVTGPNLSTDTVEPLYQTSYGVTRFSPAQLQAWTTGEVDGALTLPPPNPFVPEDVSIAAQATDTGVAVKLQHKDGVELWHHQDVSYETPRAYTRIEFFVPGTEGIRARVTNMLFAQLVKDSLQEFAYEPSLAGLQFSMRTSPTGFVVSVSGYSDKQGTLLDALLERVTRFQVDPVRFELERDELARNWRNRIRKRPITQVSDRVNEAISPTSFAHAARAKVASTLTVEELQAWADHIRNGTGARVLVHGNITADKARVLAASVADALGDAPATAPSPKIVRRIPNRGVVVRNVNIDHNDSVYIALYQGREASIVESARYMMLAQVLRTPFFTELRTNQQLGYSVRAGYQRDDLVPALRIAIQSSNAGPVTLQRQSDAFLADFHRTLRQMPNDEYATIRQGLITKLEQKELRMGQRNARYLSNLFLGFEQFDRTKQLIEAIRGVEQQDLATMYAERLVAEDAGRLIVRSFGNAHDEAPSKADCADTTCVVERMPDVFEREVWTP